MSHFAADYCNLHIKVNNFRQGDNLPVSISVLQSTGWRSPSKEVCSVDGNLTAATTTVLFESLPIGVPLFLSVTGSVKLADGNSDSLISGLEGYLGSSVSLHVEAIRTRNNNKQSQQRQSWNDGPRRMERQYSIDRHQSSNKSPVNNNVTTISNSLSTLEKKVKGAENMQSELKNQLTKILMDVDAAKASSNTPGHFSKLQERIGNLSKSPLFNGNMVNNVNTQQQQQQQQIPRSNNNNSNNSSNNDSNNNNNNSKPYPTPIDRKMSVQSRQRIMKLDDLNTRFNVCQSEFNGLIDTLRHTTKHADRMKIKDALSQLYGNLEKLQYVEIDSIVVGDLQSGQKEAKEARKRLTKQVTNLLNAVKDKVKQLST